MALFEVPGWSVPNAPVAESSTSSSRKRKRPTNDTDSEKKVRSAEVNLEKIVKTLTGKSRDKDRSKAKKKKEKQKQPEDCGEKKMEISRPMPLKAVDKRGSTSSLPPAKKAKTKHEKSASQETLVKPSQSVDSLTSESGLTPMQKSMKHSLEGARFRLINEQLYKNDSKEARRLMEEDPSMYTEYHNGFRHQVQSWPTNPVDQFVSTLAKYPKKTVIADLGCGDAAIARNLIPEGMTVLSYDLKSDNPFVTETDICGRLPLPGSEGTDGHKSHGEGHVVDVAVFSLSLMGTNWPMSIREAWRILKADGELKIAEVTSRFTDIERFVNLISSIGFKLKSKVAMGMPSPHQD
ncbi:25S rRNA (adenine645-N1)-methyltransferase [Paramarasmius palmivorus]|uniref:Ribosomal RNA-processing protein 8 n=1 Tax=Paramarasmius palmivorus TaxID=297713 RepID=A0AAW0DET2_9AGAR